MSTTYYAFNWLNDTSNGETLATPFIDWAEDVAVSSSSSTSSTSSGLELLIAVIAYHHRNRN